MNERQARNARRVERLQKLRTAREELDAAIYRFLPECLKLTDVVTTAPPFSERDPFTVFQLITGTTEAIGKNLALLQKVWQLSEQITRAE